MTRRWRTMRQREEIGGSGGIGAVVGSGIVDGVITGARRTDAHLSLDQLSVVLDLLAVDELPGVLDWRMPHDSDRSRRIAFDRAFAELVRAGLVSDGRPAGQATGSPAGQSTGRPAGRATGAGPSVDSDLTRWILLLTRPVRDIELRMVEHTGRGPLVRRACLSAGGIGGTEHVFAVRDSDPDRFHVQLADPRPLDRVMSWIGDGRGCASATVSAPTQFMVDVLDAASSRRDVTAALLSLGVDDTDAGALAVALSRCTRHVEIVANSRRGSSAARVGDPVAVLDTPDGRIVALTTTSADGSRWSTLAPGSTRRIRSELETLVAATR